LIENEEKWKDRVRIVGLFINYFHKDYVIDIIDDNEARMMENYWLPENWVK
jgi:hypothetical protein